MVGEDEEEASERKVEQTAALLRETVERLLEGGYPPDLVAEAARENLLNLRPHLEGALDALAQTELRRALTDGELACRHTFRMLLDDTK